MIKENLTFFLKNGKFEHINFGIKINELIDIIGNPDFVLPEKSKNPTLFKYGNVEFYFEDEKEDARLHFIQIDFPVNYSENSKLVFEGYDWTTELTIENAISFLQKNKINFEEKIDSNNLEFWRILQTESGVEIYFTNQRDEEIWELHSFGRSIQLNLRRELKKQISFEIKKKYYEQLRKKSIETKVSIANLSAEIIENYLKDI